jgi:drug/metabolite transporter (DMT)-like permease
MTEPAARPVAWMLLAAWAFATMGTFASALGPRCDWVLIALVRVVFMFTSAALLAHSARVPLVLWKPPTLWLRSLAGSFSLVCNFYALTRLPVAEMLTLSNAYPLWIVLLSAVMLQRGPRLGELLGVLCGVAGVVLLERPDVGGERLAVSVALLGSVSSAFAMIGLHRLKGVDPRAVVAHFSGVATIVAAAWLAFRWRRVTVGLPEPSTLALLLGVGVTGTVGQLFLTKAYASGPPARVSVVALTQVVFALIYDVAIWRRPITPLTFAGSCLVLIPTAWMYAGKPEQPGSDAEYPQICDDI